MFQDRFEAGRRLARELAPWREGPGALVLAVPLSGIPVAEADPSGTLVTDRHLDLTRRPSL